ncbi:hypothetical protein EDB83DRAFT_2204585, partial [Lactarius deliciosus]
VNHWAIPRPIWKEMEAEKRGDKHKQLKLDGIFEKVRSQREFMHDGILHTVAQYVACDDQSLAVTDKALFRNCLVAMRPKSISKDLPSTHNVMRYIHNKFVQWLQELKDDIMV